MELNDLGDGRVVKQETPNSAVRIPNKGVQIRHLSDEVVGFIKLRAVEVTGAYYEASVYDSVFMDTTVSSATVRLPVGNDFGDQFEIIDAAGNFGVNNLVLISNGVDTVMGGPSYTISTSGRSVVLKYRASKRDWRVIG